jgi:hypothetical protein
LLSLQHLEGWNFTTTGVELQGFVLTDTIG